MAHDRQAIMVVDLAFGDCGKGTIVDFLTRRCNAHTVIRFNGGPQAAHNVVTSDGRHHTFAQIGSGAFVPGVRTFLSRFMLIEPYAMLNEAAHLEEIGVANPLGGVIIDRRCPVITPAHQAANRLREIARGEDAHGTCGMGIGETMQDLIEHPQMMLHAGDLSDRSAVRNKLRSISEFKFEQTRELIAEQQKHPRAQHSIETLTDASWIQAAVDNYAEVARQTSIIDQTTASAIFQQEGALIFEGSQGVLLDEWFGFHPHTTWSTTTFANAQTLLDEVDYDAKRTRVGVLRSYFTRHGAGPMVTGSESHLSLQLRRVASLNVENGWPGRFRTGAFDAVAARYALAVAGGVEFLAVTHLDCLPGMTQEFCGAYSGSEDQSLFSLKNGRILDIKVRQPPSLSHQEKLTAALRQCKPIYEPLHSSSTEDFIEMLERELCAHVGILSTGPTARDKRFTHSLDRIGI